MTIELPRLQVLAEAAAVKQAAYKISWKGYPNNPKPEVHGIAYFCDANGFDKDDIKAIKDLMPGEEHTTGGPTDSVTIVRLKKDRALEEGLMTEGAYVVKSKDGVEKRFKSADSAEAKAWAASTQKKPAKVKAEKYSQAWWDDKYLDNKSGYMAGTHSVFPSTKIDELEVGDQFDKIAKQEGLGRVEDWTVGGRGTSEVDGVRVATISIRMMFSFGKEDDLGLDVEGDERVSDTQYITLRRDTKNPKKLVFAGYKG